MSESGRRTEGLRSTPAMRFTVVCFSFVYQFERSVCCKHTNKKKKHISVHRLADTSILNCAPRRTMHIYTELVVYPEHPSSREKFASKDVYKQPTGTMAHPDRHRVRSCETSHWPLPPLPPPPLLCIRARRERAYFIDRDFRESARAALTPHPPLPILRPDKIRRLRQAPENCVRACKAM